FLQDGSLDGLWYWDLENLENEWMNPRFWTLLGYDPQEKKHLASEWQDLIYSEDLQVALDNFHKHCSNPNHPYDQVVRYRHKNGSTVWIRCRGIVIRDETGKPIRMLGAHTDLTPLKQAEEELQMAKDAAESATLAKSEFLANMSHEIRTPMNAIIGMTHLTQQTELTAKQRDYLNKIHSSANMLLRVINDILDFSKIEAGKLKMEVVDFSLKNVMDNLASMIAVKAQEKGLKILFPIADDVPLFLVGDPLRLSQVLINLTTNAIKFTESGEVVVSVDCEKITPDWVFLRFCVTDTGIGLTEDQQTRLFKAFDQADTSTTRQYGGTGLGLSISKKLVEMMGGEISVESKPGQGSTFTITIGFGLSQKEKIKDEVPVKPLSAAIEEKDKLQGLRILLVEDNKINQLVAQELLKVVGIVVEIANNGREAVDKVRTDTFDGVLMDIQMPEMDGFEATIAIRNMADKKNLPIIAMTAHAMVGDREKSIAAGMNDHITKPIEPDELYSALLKWIKPQESGQRSAP
ncbi:MAG: response regulator, partial [Deltaproteobacteria bacterium]|nr:response regulator [Deltaproteobacteria bacterium]